MLLAGGRWRPALTFAAASTAIYLPFAVADFSGLVHNVFLWPAYLGADSTSWLAFAPPPRGDRRARRWAWRRSPGSGRAISPGASRACSARWRWSRCWRSSAARRSTTITRRGRRSGSSRRSSSGSGRRLRAPPPSPPRPDSRRPRGCGLRGAAAPSRTARLPGSDAVMAEPQRPSATPPRLPGARFLVVEARYYDAIGEMLLDRRPRRLRGRRRRLRCDLRAGRAGNPRRRRHRARRRRGQGRAIRRRSRARLRHPRRDLSISRSSPGNPRAR